MSSDGSAVRVDLMVPTLFGLLKLGTMTYVSVDGVWNASEKQSLVLQNVLSLTNLGSANVVFRFSAVGGSTVQIDDVYLDPIFHD